MSSSSLKIHDIVEFRAYSSLFRDARPIQKICARVVSTTTSSALVSWMEESPNRLLICHDRIPLRRLSLVGHQDAEEGLLPTLSFNENPED